MNTSFADTAGIGAAIPAPPAPAAKPLGTTLVTLVRREFWEHRVLWIAPAVVSALMIVGVLVASAKYRNPHASLSDEGPGGMTMFAVMQGSISMPLAVVMLIVLVFYLLDCLYAERRDRSILFWKSMPVSDGLTVLSKLTVATLIVPLGVFVLGLLLSLVFTGIWQVNALLGRLPQIPAWDMVGWLRAELALLLCFVVGALWYAPCAAYLLVVSAWARRSPFLWLLLPPVAAQILEQVAFGSHYVGGFISYRLAGIWPILFGHMHLGRGRAFALSSALNQLNLGAALSDIDLWLGLAAAAGLVFAAIRIRRYRDDT
jgi:ABC-2 type transport system permease protein